MCVLHLRCTLNARLISHINHHHLYTSCLVMIKVKHNLIYIYIYIQYIGLLYKGAFANLWIFFWQNSGSQYWKRKNTHLRVCEEELMNLMNECRIDNRSLPRYTLFSFCFLFHSVSFLLFILYVLTLLLINMWWASSKNLHMQCQLSERHL